MEDNAKSDLPAAWDPHVGVGQNELADGGVQHEPVDALVQSDDPVEQEIKLIKSVP